MRHFFLNFEKFSECTTIQSGSLVSCQSKNCLLLVHEIRINLNVSLLSLSTMFIVHVTFFFHKMTLLMKEVMN